MTELDADDLLPVWQDTAIQSVPGLGEERVSEVFLDLLGQLTGSSSCFAIQDARWAVKPVSLWRFCIYLSQRQPIWMIFAPRWNF